MPGLMLAAIAGLAVAPQADAQMRGEAALFALESSAELQRREPEGGPQDPSRLVDRAGSAPWYQAVPGEEIIVTVAFTIVSGQHVHDARISTAIPAGFVYVAGSAQGPAATVLFSIDGGASFVPAAELVVHDPEGSRDARAEDYTHLRWLLPGPFEPGVRGFLRYRARAE